MLVNKQNILMTSKNLILIAVATIGLIYLAKSTKNQASERFQIEKQPQEYMTQILIKSYTKEGTLKSIMNAERWAYLPETESSTVTLPHLTLYKADGSVWILNAKQGHIQQSTIGQIGIVQLLHDVKTHYLDARKDGTKPIDIRSTMAEFDDKQGTATYQGNVVMNQGGATIRGETLVYFLNTHVLSSIEAPGKRTTVILPGKNDE